MPVPYLGNALNGWTDLISVKIVTKVVVNHQVEEITTDMLLNINIQPTPASIINKKTDEERTWKWWSLIVKNNGTVLKSEDIVIVYGKKYRIKSASDWSASGFQLYESIEDYED